MLRLVLSLFSSLQIGARIRETIERSIRQAILIAIASVILLFAIGFGLVAAYQALILYGFTSLAASGVVAGALAVISFLTLLSANRIGKQKREEPSLVDAPAEGIAIVDQSVGKAMKQVGPLTLLAIAFAAGLLASRRR